VAKRPPTKAGKSTLILAVSVSAALLLAAAAGAAAGGCSLIGGRQTAADKPPVIEGFPVVDPATLGEPWLTAWYQACLRVPGVHVASFDGQNTYILAARGPKPTAGYRVELRRAEPGADGYTLLFRTVDPKPSDVVAQVVTYPAVLILTPHPADAITDVLFEGSESLPWPAPSPANAAIVPTEPLPGDRVSGTTLHLAGYARVFEAEFQYSLEDGATVLASGGVMASAGGPSWGQYSLDINFPAPSGPDLLLRLFDESAEDGSIIFEADIPLQWTGGK